MLRFEKIKEFKNLNAITRVFFSERHGMILSIPGGESCMKVHSFATGKLLFQHRFGPKTLIGTARTLFKIGRWVFIRYMQFRTIESVFRTVYVWVAFDFDTLTAKELLTENEPSGRGVLGRAGNKLVFSCHTGPYLGDPYTSGGKIPFPGDDILVFDLDDGSFTPMPGMTGLRPSVSALGTTRCFNSKEEPSSSGWYPKTACALDGRGLPTTVETGELDHVEADFVRLCGSRCYLFLLADGYDSGMRELLACDPEMREIKRFRLPPLPDGEIKYSYDLPEVVELRQPAAPGVLLSVRLTSPGGFFTAPRMIRYLFFDQECRTLLWQHEAVQDNEFGISPPYLMDGYIVRPRAEGAELINTVTGEASEVRTGERVPLFYPANGYWFETSPGVASSLYEDPPSHVFWREFDGAPLCCGVVTDSATAASALPPPSVPPALPPTPARKRKKPDLGIPVFSERAEGAHILCTKSSALSPQLKAFGQWLAFFRKGGVNLHGYIYDVEGPGDLPDADLKQMGHTREEIKCIRLAATDDWHDPAALAADLRRCEALVPEKPANSKSRKWILRELKQLMALCDKASASGDKVQLLAPPADCEDDWDDDGEDDEDEE